ncbi:MAG: DNA glycosylase [Clostridia bacterium]|nr:DNA glycosylase [Clostridia bacterium]
MKYSVVNDRIEIEGKEEFNPKDILECGQIFRFYKNEDNDYVVLSKNLKATIEENETGYTIICSDTDYFVKFFNLDINYTEIKNRLKKDKFLAEVIEKGEGIRIIKNDLFETICCFIISANNNIKRIKLILSRLTEAVGNKLDDKDFCFPTVEQFKSLDERFFAKIGAGYRARYLSRLAENFENLLKVDTENLSTDELRKELLKITGVGPKVADCIMLFAYNRYDVFPVDVWTERVYLEHLGGTKMDRKKIAKDLVKRYGNLAGFAQQYLYYYKAIEKF